MNLSISKQYYFYSYVVINETDEKSNNFENHHKAMTKKFNHLFNIFIYLSIICIVINKVVSSDLLTKSVDIFKCNSVFFLKLATSCILF